MNNARLIGLLDELRDHLSNSQGMDLKGLMDSEKMPKPDPMGEDPKGVAVEKVSLMGQPMESEDAAMDSADGVDMGGGDDEEMNDDELEELLRNALS